jgi:hypothetical protein
MATDWRCPPESDFTARLEVLEARVQPPHDLPGLGLHGGVVERADARHELASEEHVRRGVDVVGEGQGLVDGLDPERLGIARVRDRDLVTVDDDLAAVRRMGSRERADERGLARAVPADEPDDLPGIKVDADVVDGVDAAERDPDVAHLHEGRLRRRGAGLRCRSDRFAHLRLPPLRRIAGG